MSDQELHKSVERIKNTLLEATKELEKITEKLNAPETPRQRKNLKEQKILKYSLRYAKK